MSKGEIESNDYKGLTDTDWRLWRMAGMAEGLDKAVWGLTGIGYDQGAEALHCILLDGALAAFALMQDGLVWMLRELPPELEQESHQMGQLLVGHQQRSAADPGAWWEVATNVGEPLPRQLEVLTIVVTQMEVDLVRGVVWRILEERE
ncbi:hypothetical protein E4T56_gene3086 [Termitomyces sp. T112]|nr:hypothetical protein E4T56_gene3086 [Termitomyces sp. T112]